MVVCVRPLEIQKSEGERPLAASKAMSRALLKAKGRSRKNEMQLTEQTVELSPKLRKPLSHKVKTVRQDTR
ncbi:hypothetical protein Tco_1317802, partial [Tanacetum coccineum]